MVLFTATSENAFVGGKCALPSALLCEGKLSGTEKCPGEYARGICAGEMSGSRTLYAYCAADKVDVIISLAHSDKTNCRVCSTLHCSTGPRIRPLNARHTSGANLLTVWAESGQIAGPAIVPGAAAAAAAAAAAYLMQSRAVHAVGHAPNDFFLLRRRRPIDFLVLRQIHRRRRNRSISLRLARPAPTAVDVGHGTCAALRSEATEVESATIRVRVSSGRERCT